MDFYLIEFIEDICYSMFFLHTLFNIFILLGVIFNIISPILSRKVVITLERTPE